MDDLDINLVRNMELDEFYDFLISDYFKWKYTDSRWLNNNIDHFSKYVENEELMETIWKTSVKN